jgi:hypothetical protein
MNTIISTRKFILHNVHDQKRMLVRVPCDAGADAGTNTYNKFVNHRQKARAIIKDASEKRKDFENSSLEKLAMWQAEVKLVIAEDIQLLKQIVSGKSSE